MASVQQSLTVRMKMICAHLWHSDGEAETEGKGAAGRHEGEPHNMRLVH